MKLVRVLLACLVLPALWLAPVAAAASLAPEAAIDFAALDAGIAAQLSKHGLPGAALAIIQGDEVVYLKGYGTAGGRAMTPQTQMFIGSQSKSFTALVIAQLAEEGRLDLNAPVQTYLPWFRVADEAASAEITLNHLLHHTSGLSEAGYSVILPADAAPEAAVRSLAQAHLTAPVGTKFQYFNAGYDVLAALIETVTGKRYAEVVKTQVFDPLGMTRSTADPAQATDLAQGYTRLFGFAVPMRQQVRDYEVGAGYIVSTAEDMARYASAMQHSGAGLITPSTAARMFTPGFGDYGMGWSITLNGAKIYHGGANEAFHTEVNLYPKRDLAFVLLVNAGHQLDHFISTEELDSSIEAVVLGKNPAPVSQSWSVRQIGGGLGVFVLALSLLHAWNFYRLKGWSERARRMPPIKKAWDVAVSFIIPAIILIVVFTQIKAFYGYRFNLWPTLVRMPQSAPDIFILMLVGSVPDVVQGLIKLSWLLMGKTNRSNNTGVVTSRALRAQEPAG